VSVARLRDALAALQRNDDAAARKALIAAWRARRSPVLAELVELLGSRDAITEQIAAIVTPRVVSSDANLKALAELDDPRLARWVIDALASLPFTAVTAERFLLRVVETAERLRDPRLIDRADAIRESIKVRIGRLAIRTKLVKRIESVVAKLPAVRAATAEELALERELATRLEPLRKTGRSAETLLADIYANPSDDGPRLVYADLLLEHADPRGELITLQLERGRGGVVTARETELLKKHGKAWLGPLASVLRFGQGFSSTTFERGFVSKADIILSVGKKLQVLLDEPSWATVEELDGSWEWELLHRAPLRGLRRINRPFTRSTLQSLGERVEPLTGMQEITVMEREVPDAAVLARAFPNLETLCVVCEQAAADTIRPLGATGARHVVIDRYYGSGAMSMAEHEVGHTELLETLARTTAWVDRLSIMPPWRSHPKPDPIAFRRGASGLFERVAR
jgi:uncharacterized protein (TIGR02996 family)